MNGINWVGALAASVAVHVAILAAMVLSSPSPSTDELDLSSAEGEAAGALPGEVSPGKQETPVTPEAPAKFEAPAKPAAASPAPANAGAVDPAVPQAVPKPSATDAGYFEYTVKSGDNLTLIAKKAGCTFTELAALNGKSVKELTNLKVGQILKLPKGEARP